MANSYSWKDQEKALFLCLLKGDSKGCDVFQVQFIEQSLQENISTALSPFGAFMHSLFN